MTDNLMALENAYNQNIEKNVEQGLQHPMLVYWHQQDPLGEPEVTISVEIKNRYSICKQCEKFDNVFKRCKQCSCFMPIKTQFKMFKCPIGKW